MIDAVIVEAVRTPLGRRNGALSGVHPADLSALVLSALVERTGIDPGLVDDVIWGCVSQVGEQTFDIARTAVLSAGWPESVPGTTVDRQCGSSQQAVHFAAAGLSLGAVRRRRGRRRRVDVPRADGSSPMANGGSPLGARYVERYGTDFPHQGLGAEMIAERWGLSRRVLDEFSLESHEKAAAAIDAGRLTGQIVPVVLDDGSVVDVDEGVRRGGTVEKLAELKPAFKEDGVFHAGNSSQISDGAAALLMTTSGPGR